MENRRPILEILSWIAGIICCVITIWLFFSSDKKNIPNDQFLLSKGKYFLEKNEPDSAIYYFDKFRLISTNENLYLLRGTAYQKKKDFNSAVEDFTRALLINPDNPTTLLMRGIAFFNLKKYGMAVTDLNIAYKLKPNDINVLNYRGLSLIGCSELIPAEADFVKAVSLQPNDPVSNYNLGLYNAHTLYVETILAIFKKKTSTQKFYQTIGCFDTAIRLKGDYIDAYYLRGRTKMKQYIFENAFTPKEQLTSFDYNEKFDIAIEDFDKVLSLKPNHREALFYRGYAKLLQKKNDEAKIDIAAAQKLGVKLDYNINDMIINDRYDLIN